jgi:AbrB family looped-hinge helix DNA binding protein
MLIGMTSKVGVKGQVVIPKQLRDELGLQPGVDVEFEADGEGVRVRPAKADHSLRGSLAGHDLVGRLEADRRGEPR